MRVSVRAVHERIAVLPQRLVDVHARPVLLEDRLRHERGGLTRGVRGVLDHVLVDHHLIGHLQKRLEAHVDLALAARGHLVVMELTPDPE